MSTDGLYFPPSYVPLSIAGGIRAAMGRDPDKIAISCGPSHRSYRELCARIDAVSAMLCQGLNLSTGNHGAVLAPNCLEYIELVAGAAQAGMPLATINPKLSPAEIATICNDAEARFLLVHASLAEMVQELEFEYIDHIIVIGAQLDALLAKAIMPVHLAPVPEWEVFTIPYTSGTTGKPKGVLVSHRSRILSLFGMGVEYGCYSPDDRFLAFAPLCHGAGMVFALAPVFFGGHVEILASFDPEQVLSRLVNGAMSGVFMVPTHFHGMFSLPDSTLDRYANHQLSSIISNAAPLPQATKEQIVSYFGPGLLHETYGSTEGGIVTNLRPQDQLRKSKCVGTPFVSTQVELRDEEGNECAPDEVGELFSKSPFLFNGYWKRPEETAKAFRDGWVTVGDMARRDDEGFIYIVDRKKDMVITGGINVYPREIEEVLMHHPDIMEAAVIGVPDEKWGEQLKAYIALRGDAELDLPRLETYCEDKLARFKIPRLLEVIPALPRNAAGKVLKTELRDAG